MPNGRAMPRYLPWILGALLALGAGFWLLRAAAGRPVTCTVRSDAPVPVFVELAADGVTGERRLLLRKGRARLRVPPGSWRSVTIRVLRPGHGVVASVETPWTELRRRKIAREFVVTPRLGLERAAPGYPVFAR